MKNEVSEVKDKKLEYATVTPTVFVNENKDGYEITFEMPGVGKDDVDLNIENRTLTLRATTRFEPPQGFTCERREFPICNYAVSLDLPEHADTSTIQGSVSNGILTAKLSKRAELKPRKIDITVD